VHEGCCGIPLWRESSRIIDSVASQKPPDRCEVDSFAELPDQKVPPIWSGQDGEWNKPKNVLRRIDLVGDYESSKNEE